MFVLGVAFTIAFPVKEAIILGGFNQVGRGPFPNLFSSGGAQGV
jgi:hypothetical protein